MFQRQNTFKTQRNAISSLDYSTINPWKHFNRAPLIGKSNKFPVLGDRYFTYHCYVLFIYNQHVIRRRCDTNPVYLSTCSEQTNDY